MNGLEIWLLAVGLAMDCFAISIASGILLKRTLWRPMLTMAFFFGLFQAIMPLLGWIGASTFSHLIESLDHWIAFIILAFLGGRMVRESFKDEDCKKEYDPKSLKVVLALAVATSIDALAIGVSFAFLGMRDFSEILAPISIIGFVSFIMSLIGLLFGIRFGCGIARKLRAELWGGIILIIIGTKAEKSLKFNVRTMVIYPVLAGLTLVGLCFVFHGMSFGFSWLGFPANRLLYAVCSVVGTMLVHQGLDGIAKYYNYKVGEDRFNFENESFQQSETLVSNDYSVNIPMIYYWKKKMHRGWINIINPFRGTIVLGTPGSGKSFGIIDPFIRQHSAKGFAMMVYDFKFV